jgi:hypothetical protein
MSEESNLFTQYSNLRAAKRAELEAAGATVAEVRQALRYVVPVLVRPRQGEHDALAEDEAEPDIRWDVPDAEGAMPGHEEAEKAVMGRLATNYEVFHSKPEA